MDGKRLLHLSVVNNPSKVFSLEEFEVFSFCSNSNSNIFSKLHNPRLLTLESSGNTFLATNIRFVLVFECNSGSVGMIIATDLFSSARKFRSVIATITNWFQWWINGAASFVHLKMILKTSFAQCVFKIAFRKNSNQRFICATLG